jgi:hypothetical protein
MFPVDRLALEILRGQIDQALKEGR